MKILIIAAISLWFEASLARDRHQGRYKRISKTLFKHNVNSTKQYLCFDSKIKNYGELKNQEFIGLVDDSLCENFEKRYELGLYRTYGEDKIACFEYDVKKEKHKKIVRLVDESNANTEPCENDLVYKPRFIPQRCGNHINCSFLMCHLDVYKSSGEKILTRPLYSNDVFKGKCLEFKKRILQTKSGGCFEYDLRTKGKEHFTGCGVVDSNNILTTEYKWSRPDDAFDFFISLFSGENCFEMDIEGGEVYKVKVSDHLCQSETISDAKRSQVKTQELNDETQSEKVGNPNPTISK